MNTLRMILGWSSVLWAPAVGTYLVVVAPYSWAPILGAGLLVVWGLVVVPDLRYLYWHRRALRDRDGGQL